MLLGFFCTIVPFVRIQPLAEAWEVAGEHWLCSSAAQMVCLEVKGNPAPQQRAAALWFPAAEGAGAVPFPQPAT